MKGFVIAQSQIAANKVSLMIMQNSKNLNFQSQLFVKRITGEEKYDLTGHYHWVPKVPLEEAILKNEKNLENQFVNHIILCVITQEYSSLVGLCNFIMPLRASSIPYNDLKDILIIAEKKLIRKEWHMIQNFPKLRVIFGSPMNKAILKICSIPYCSSCVIISSQNARDPRKIKAPSLIDKEAILCTLNIMSIYKNNDTERKISKSNEGAEETEETEKDLLLNVLSKKYTSGILNRDLPGAENLIIFTELYNANNGIFLVNSSGKMKDPLMSEGYASGLIFNIRFLDSLLSTTYYSPNILLLLQEIVTGRNSEEIAQILAEGNGLPGMINEEINSNEPKKSGDSLTQKNDRKISCNSCRIRQLSLSTKPLMNCLHLSSETIERSEGSFQQLFRNALQMHSIICIGLYRKFDLEDTSLGAERYELNFLFEPE